MGWCPGVVGLLGLGVMGWLGSGMVGGGWWVSWCIGVEVDCGQDLGPQVEGSWGQVWWVVGWLGPRGSALVGE